MGKTKEKDKERPKNCNGCEHYREGRLMKKHIKSLQKEVQRLMAIIRGLNREGKDLSELEGEVDKNTEQPASDETKCESCGSTNTNTSEISIRGGKRIITVCLDCGKRKTTKG